MHKSILFAALSLASAIGATAIAQTGTTTVGAAPGVKAIAQTVQAEATITAIDAATRDVTMKGADGKEITVTAGPEVKNFAQLKKGDKVNLEYVEALVVELKKGGGLPVARTDKADAISAKPGATPGAAAGRKVTVVGDVIDVNAAKQSVTVRGPKRTIDLPIRDAEQFKLISKGDQLQATYVEAVAVSVTPKAKP